MVVELRFLAGEELAEILELVVLRILGYGLRKEAVAVVEDRRKTRELVDVVVDKKAEIAEMPVGIENDRVKEEDVGKTHVLTCLLAVEHIPCSEEACLVARKERTRRAEPVLELREVVGNVRQFHRRGNLRGVVFGERLVADGVAVLEKAAVVVSTALVEQHLSIQPPPALAEIAVRRILRRSRGVAYARALVAGKGHGRNRCRKRIVVKVRRRPLFGRIVLNDPMHIVKRQPPAEGDEIPLPIRIVLEEPEVAKHVADSSTFERRRAVKQPLLQPVPQRFRLLPHMLAERKRQESLGGGVHLDVLHAERLHPVKPQDFRISMLENQTFRPISLCASSRRNVVSHGNWSSAATAAAVVSRTSRSVSSGG